MTTKWHTKTPDEPDWMPARRRLDAHGRPELWVNPALFGDVATPRPRRAAAERGRPQAPRDPRS